MKKLFIKAQNAIALRNTDEGATIAEYGVAVAFVAVVAGAGVLLFGETIGGWFEGLFDELGL